MRPHYGRNPPHRADGVNFGPRLDLRQSQQLVMTPQLQQAIKLLALSNLEIETFVSNALEANPLLDMGEAEDSTAPAGPMEEPADDPPEATPPDMAEAPLDDLVQQTGKSDDHPLDIAAETLDIDRDTGDSNWNDGAASGLNSSEIGSSPRPVSGDMAFDIADHGAPGPSLHEHLTAQIGLAAQNAQQAFILRHLVGHVDDAGYLDAPLRDIAQELGLTSAPVEDALMILQRFEPTGIGARDLAECLTLQAKEADRHDPCMERLLANLDLLAKGQISQLKRICKVDDEDLAGMITELRSYDPKPGLLYGGVQGGNPILPDILLHPARHGGWDIALNPATLPRLVVNRQYYIELREGCPGKDARSWLSEKLADANWLIKALDQRQKTILKVAAEIVKQQDGFFRHGVAHLKPLTLRMVADAVDMHESTISRVTSSKYLHCPRGTFELKYFFSSGVGASADGEGGASSEAVKSRIRALIAQEPADAIFSDDQLVDILKKEGFDLARRTVAKYREAIGLGSSVQRRRQRKLEAAL